MSQSVDGHVSKSPPTPADKDNEDDNLYFDSEPRTTKINGY